MVFVVATIIACVAPSLALSRATVALVSKWALTFDNLHSHQKGIKLRVSCRHIVRNYLLRLFCKTSKYSNPIGSQFSVRAQQMAGNRKHQCNTFGCRRWVLCFWKGRILYSALGSFIYLNLSPPRQLSMSTYSPVLDVTVTIMSKRPNPNPVFQVFMLDSTNL